MDWRYYWRRYLEWFPLQWCYTCGKAIWGGFPQWSFRDGHWQWMPGWMEYCSKECCDEEMEICEAMSVTVRDDDEVPE